MVARGSTLFWESVNGYRLGTACTAISMIALNPSAVCLSDTEETLEHILVCPALANEQYGLKRIALEKLHELQFPFSETTPTLKLTMSLTKFKEVATPMCTRDGLPHGRIERLIKDYCITNHSKPFLSTRQFLKSLMLC